MEQGFVPRKFYPREAQFEPVANDAKRYIERLVIDEDSRHSLGYLEHQDKSEAYTLEVTENGEALIKTASPLGGLRALETFTQLFFAHSSPLSGCYTPHAPIFIKDIPRFEHRGLNMDISRNWIPQTDPMRTIEAIEDNKLNRLTFTQQMLSLGLLRSLPSQIWP